MYACPIRPNCTIPFDNIVPFSADPDIDGIGVIAAFYTAASLTVLLLAATYFICDPTTFDDFGFCQLDEVIVGNFQTALRKNTACKRTSIKSTTSVNTFKALEKAILILSDQQLLAGAAIAMVGLIRHCDITQYHFNTVINLALAASIAHSMTFSFVSEYVYQNSFFRTWRAIAMLLLGALCFGTWIVTGNNNWLSAYGLPAQCGYDNLGDGFGPPALTSLAILYWFLLRGYVFSFTVLIPSSIKLQKLCVGVSTIFWLAQLCRGLRTLSARAVIRLEESHNSLLPVYDLPHVSPPILHTRKFLNSFSYAFWYSVFVVVRLVHASVYGVAQVWSSFAFSLLWACYTLAGSAKLIALYRATAADNGMTGSESRWGYGQQLTVLMLATPVFAILEAFFDDPVQKDNTQKSNRAVRSARVVDCTSIEVDSNSMELKHRNKNATLMSQQPSEDSQGNSQQIITGSEDNIPSDSPPSQPPVVPGDSSVQEGSSVPSDQPGLSGQVGGTGPTRAVDGDEFENELWKSIVFKSYLIFVFAGLSFIVLIYGI